MIKLFMRSIAQTLNLLSKVILNIAGRENVSFFLAEQNSTEDEALFYGFYQKPE